MKKMKRYNKRIVNPAILLQCLCEISLISLYLHKYITKPLGNESK
jgi:hypothetical protein